MQMITRKEVETCKLHFIFIPGKELKNETVVRFRSLSNWNLSPKSGNKLNPLKNKPRKLGWPTYTEPLILSL